VKSRAAVLTVLFALAGPPPTAPQGGMASPPRARPTVKNVETALPPISVDFRDVAAEAGLTAVHVSGGVKEKKYILEATGSGVALFDYDGDGRTDIFLASGTTLDPDPKVSPTGHLYRNLGQLRFEEATEKAGLRRTGWGQGVCVGDYDNDGRRDLFLASFGQSLLYRNLGGRFEDVTGSAGLQADRARWDTGCTFVDYDLDGDLDLAVTAYLEFDRAKIPAPGSSGYCTWKGIPVMCGPRGLPFARNHLFRNEGQGRFTDVSTASGIGAATRCYAFTVVASDLDDDGYPDLYVACDSTPSLLYRNKRDGTFEEIGLLAGVALNEDGQEQGGMGVAVADIDEDGRPDIVKTNFSDDVPNVYLNLGGATFEDRVFRAGLGASMEYVGWGVMLFDVDHDGRRDLLMVNGHVYPEADKTPGLRYEQPRLLYWNVGEARFKDISTTSGPGLTAARSSRGAAVGDLDDDGALEVVISNLGAPPSLLKNFGTKKNWLLVWCVGTRANRDALGARVSVFAGGKRISGELQGGTSFVSQNDARLHFGLGPSSTYDRIEVRWPGGRRETFPAGAANRVVVLTEGAGQALKDATP
jgi:enediyne biosynthesis protein E4